MAWQDWLTGLELPIAISPDLGGLVLAAVLVVGAYWLGWFGGSRVGKLLARRLHRFAGDSDSFDANSIGAIAQYLFASLLLLIIGNTAVLSPLGMILLAFGLGVAVAMIAFRLLRAFAIGPMNAGVIAIIALVVTTAGTLGGMTPLVDGLNAVGFTVGKRRFSLLYAINAVVLIVTLFAMARVANRILVHAVGRLNQLDISQRVLMQKLGGIAVAVVAILIGVDLLAIDLTALTVFSGALGLAIGFGLQKTFGNMLAGIILLMDRSVKPGDVIAIGDTYGAVSKIGIRAVSIVTREGKEHLIPNEQLVTETVENWSYSNRDVRVHIPVGVSYSSDIALAQRLMIQAAEAADRVLKVPKPSVWLTGFGDSSVDHDILVWISDPEAGVGNVKSDILNRLWLLFKENSIEIPFPQRDIHVRNLPGSLKAVETAGGRSGASLD